MGERVRLPFVVLFVSVLASPAFSVSLNKASLQLRSVERVFQFPSTPLRTGKPVEVYNAEKDALLKQLGDNNPAIREAAARSLKSYIQDSEVRHKLVSVSENSYEKTQVRSAAIKSLSLNVHGSAARYGSGKVRDRLFSLGKNAQQDEAVRVIALKALYAAQDNQIGDQLADIMESSYFALPVRRAAAWALFASNDIRSRQRLVSLAESSHSDDSLKIEAVKSLFSHMPNVHARVLAIARNKEQAEAVRATAILALQAANGQSTVRNFLTTTANEGNQLLREAAIRALEREISLETARFFHLYNYRGAFIDPLELE